MQDRVDVVVVGAGLAGLTAAAFAARAGRSVRVLEKAADTGGRAASRTLDGFVFNQGPHALYRQGPGTAVLHELGIQPDGAPPAEGYLGELDGREGLLPVSPRALLASPLLSWREKWQVARLMGSIPRLRSPAFDGHTVADWLGGLGLGPSAHALMLAMVRLSTYVNAPEQQSAGAAIRQLQDALRGNVLYLHGGWSQLVAALRSTATSAGAIVRSHAGVRALEETANGWRVLTDDEAVEAAAVVLAVPPAAAAGLTGLAFDTLVPARAACLDVALRRLPRPDRPFLLGLDRPLYASVHSLAARLAPEGHALIHVARYLAPGTSAVRAELEDFLDVLQPGWRAETVHARFLPEMVVTHDAVCAAPGGLRGRTPVALPDRPGIFVCGDWVGDAGQLAHAALASGSTAGRLAAAVPAAARAA